MTLTPECRPLLDEPGDVRLEGFIEPVRESAWPIDSRPTSSHTVAGSIPGSP